MARANQQLYACGVRMCVGELRGLDKLSHRSYRGFGFDKLSLCSLVVKFRNHWNDSFRGVVGSLMVTTTLKSGLQAFSASRMRTLNLCLPTLKAPLMRVCMVAYSMAWLKLPSKANIGVPLPCPGSVPLKFPLMVTPP